MGGQGGTGGDVQGDWSLRRSSGACGGSIKRGIFNNEPLWNLRRSCALYNTRVSTRPVECSPSLPHAFRILPSAVLLFYPTLFSCWWRAVCLPLGAKLYRALFLCYCRAHCFSVAAELLSLLVPSSVPAERAAKSKHHPALVCSDDAESTNTAWVEV